MDVPESIHHYLIRRIIVRLKTGVSYLVVVNAGYTRNQVTNSNQALISIHIAGLSMSYVGCSVHQYMDYDRDVLALMIPDT